MTETLAAAAFAAIGVIGGAIITVFGGRGRLHRLEAVSRILKDMSPDDPGFDVLSEVRRKDAVDLQASQHSPVPFLIVVPVIGTLISVGLWIYGTAILAWSPFVYVVLVVALALSLIALVGFYVGVAIAGLRELWRWSSAKIAASRTRRAGSTSIAPSASAP